MNVKIAEIPRESDLLLRCQFRLIPKKQDVVVRQSMVEVLNLRVRNGLRHIHAADDAADHGCRGLYIDRLVNALCAGVRKVLRAPGDPFIDVLFCHLLSPFYSLPKRLRARIYGH